MQLDIGKISLKTPQQSNEFANHFGKLKENQEIVKKSLSVSFKINLFQSILFQSISERGFQFHFNADSRPDLVEVIRLQQEQLESQERAIYKQQFKLDKNQKKIKEIKAQCDKLEKTISQLQNDREENKKNTRNQRNADKLDYVTCRIL